jgi:hypothetical protein
VLHPEITAFRALSSSPISEFSLKILCRLWALPQEGN